MTKKTNKNKFSMQVIKSGKTVPELSKEYSEKFGNSIASAENSCRRYCRISWTYPNQGIKNWAELFGVEVIDLFD